MTTSRGKNVLVMKQMENFGCAVVITFEVHSRQTVWAFDFRYSIDKIVLDPFVVYGIYAGLNGHGRWLGAFGASG